MFAPLPDPIKITKDPLFRNLRIPLELSESILKPKTFVHEQDLHITSE